MCELHQRCEEDKTFVRPVRTYGAEVWTLNKDIAKLLAAFERKVLKGTLEGIKVDGSLRKRYNRN
jgi:hypothetical protein